MRNGDINDITGVVVDAAMKVHSALGPGMLESAYETCLAYELRNRGYKVDTQVGLPLVYEDIRMEIGYRADMVVNDAVLVENKALEKVLPVHEVQLFSYLRLSGLRVGLLFNFHSLHLKDGIKRVVNRL